MTSLKIAVVQDGPVFLNVEKSIEKAVGYIEEASQQDCQLVVFGETWLSGYPGWLDYCTEYALWNHEPAKEVFLRFYQNAITIPGKETDVLCKKAEEHGLDIVIGVNEKVNQGPGNGTIFNSLLIIDSSGNLVNHHRKLMPTYTEKLLYGTGDAAGLKSIKTPYGQLSGLICWEHWMPLARQVLHNCGETIHVALWPTVHEMHQVCSRHYAFEGRCFVIAVGQILKVCDLPQELRLREDLENEPNKNILNGNSCIIGPKGDFLLKPQADIASLITFEIENLEDNIKERMTLDSSGHYARPDIFELKTDLKRLL